MANRPFAGPGHMVQNYIYWWASCRVGLPKQRNLLSMWLGPAKGLLSRFDKCILKNKSPTLLFLLSLDCYDMYTLVVWEENFWKTVPFCIEQIKYSYKEGFVFHYKMDMENVHSETNWWICCVQTYQLSSRQIHNIKNIMVHNFKLFHHIVLTLTIICLNAAGQYV